MRITVLVNNLSRGGWNAEHGLALALAASGGTLLFDTGAGAALAENCRKFGCGVTDFSRVVLSHGHSDHTGGLALCRPRTVYCAPGITRERFSRHADGRVHALSMPADGRAVLDGAEVRHEISGFTEIQPGLWLTGPVPRVSGEDTGGDFFLDTACTRADLITDE